MSLVSSENEMRAGALTVQGENTDPFLAYADTYAPRFYVGKLLKFSKKGQWVAGEANELIPHGTKFVVAMDQMLVGWVKWSEGKPVEHVVEAHTIFGAAHVSPPGWGN